MSALSKILRDTENNGLLFMCPGCKVAHHIRHGVGDGPSWQWNGDAEKPTFSPSILVRYPTWHPPATSENPNQGSQTKIDVVCHSFVTNGKIQFLSDCTHALANQTVNLPEFN